MKSANTHSILFTSLALVGIARAACRFVKQTMAALSNLFCRRPYENEPMFHVPFIEHHSIARNTQPLSLHRLW